MKTAHLHDAWAAPDNSRLTPKQYSLRFPVHVAAKIAALCELYPHKTRTQIIADLLSTALDDLEKNLSQALGAPLSREDEYIERMVADHQGYKYEDCYELDGPRRLFRNVANRHYAELEKEMGTETPGVLYPQAWITEADLKR